MIDDDRTLELYIHIPFCVQKCNYCDFLSFAADDDTKKKYIDMLIAEMQLNTVAYGDYRVTSVFIGGGTPSVIPSSAIAKVMDVVRANYNLDDNAEITIEANPGTLTESKLEDYLKSGINRLSIGLQSADVMELSLLGRIHDFDDFLNNFRAARRIGFDNINVDLMSGIPGQTLEKWKYNLEKVIELRPEHISAYGLIIEEGTLFWDEYGEDGPLSGNLPDEDTERDMYYLTRSMLEEAGYHQYEISNYALAGYECEHNKGYWTRKNYLGFGLGAASFIHDCRWNNTKNMSEYLRGIGNDSVEKLSLWDAMSEFMFLGLRLSVGVSEIEFENLFKYSIMEMYGTHVERMISEGLLERKDGRYRLTYLGMDLANYVMSGFIL